MKIRKTNSYAYPVDTKDEALFLHCASGEQRSNGNGCRVPLHKYETVVEPMLRLHGITEFEFI